MSVPVEALPNVKCNACNKYLSHFPIYINQKSQLPICGRCSEHLPINEGYIRDTPYESMAQFLKFPCIYASEGCVEHLTPVEVPNHEKHCSYRIVSCALDCVWQGTLRELIDHVEEIHPTALLRDGEFEVNILGTYEVYSFLLHKDEIFIFKRNFDSVEKLLRCSVSCYKTLDSVTDYFYEITVYNGTRSLSLKFPLKSANSFQEENVTEISVDDIKRTLDDPSIIIGSVKIFTIDEQEQTPMPKTSNPDINVEMLTELECPVCLEYIIPPIYQCVTGHSICAECKPKISICPTCREDIKNTQNFTLEKMALLLNYPCKFSEFGCEFVSKPGKQLKQHQKYCLFGPQKCPLKDYENCRWKDAAKEIYSHVIDKHYDNILDIDNLYVFMKNDYFDTEDNQCYIKKFSNVMFKLHYRYSRNCFYWSMQLIGSPEEAKNYKFEIDILDTTNNNQKIFMRSFCAPLKEKNDTFDDPSSYVFLKLEQIGPFITDQLNYTVRIVKR